MKTIAELKREAMTGKLFGELTYRFGETGDGIPERLRGKRPLVRSNTVGVFFKNADGRESELRLPRKELFEYTGDSLKIYNAGMRELTAEEKALLDEWQKIEAEIPPYQETYWRKKDFFKKRGAEHLLGFEMVRGEKLEWTYDENKNHKVMIRSEHVKGDLILEYTITREVA